MPATAMRLLKRAASALTGRSRRARRLAAGYRLGEGARRIYHHHIRKSAGTSLNSAFWKLGGLDLKTMGRRTRVVRNGLVFARFRPDLVEEGHYFFANSHAPAHAIDLPPGTFTVTILRDPVDRVLSYYRYLRWAGTDAVKADPAALWIQRERAAYLDERESLPGFLERLPRKERLRQLYTFSAGFDVREAARRIRESDAVGFTDTFHEFVPALATRLGLPLEVLRERKTRYEYEPSGEELAMLEDSLEPERRLLRGLR